MLSALRLDANNAAHRKRPHNFQMPMATYVSVAAKCRQEALLAEVPLSGFRVPPAPALVLSSGSILFLEGLV